MSSLVTGAVGGLPAGLQTLAQVGVSLGRDGKLTLDEDKLREAAVGDLRGVARIFAKDDEAVPETLGIAYQLQGEIEGWVDAASGLLKAKTDGLQGRIDDLSDRIASMEARLDAYEESLRRQFTELERVMSQLQAQSSYLAQQLAQR
jgi:flagellar hook-associated protein 2